MKLIIPRNIYSAIFALSLPDEMKESIMVESSSLIIRELKNGNADIGLIPSIDLLKHNDLFVSKKIGISFDGLLSNSYLHLIPETSTFSDVYLNGDVSLNEIVLTKIIFKERFKSEVTIHLDSNPLEFGKKNYLIVGKDNDSEENFDKGISFSDLIAEIIDRPYVNFVLVSPDKNKLKNFTEKMENWDKKIEDNLEDYLNNIDEREEVSEFIRLNFNSAYFEITENEMEGLNDLLKLPFYHGMIDEIVELKWI
ncbi:hypothetical protein ACFLTH_01495 [Bacteroidota bacterium]